MKWSIVGLLFFGIVAAVCAAVLVAFIQVRNKPQDGLTLEIFVAAKALPRGKIMDPVSIEKREVPKKEVPEGACTNEVQVIGKVLAQPMLEGQAFTTDCFAQQGSGYRVASVLQPGMRAKTLSLQDHQGLYGILYAGCFVDVLVSFKSSDSALSREAMSTPLFQKVQVLSVDAETLVNEKEDGPSPEGKKSSLNRSKKLLVALAVDLKEANALALAEQYGTISLVLRNPMDEDYVRVNQALLSQLASGQMPGLFKRLLGTGTAEAQTAGTPGAGREASGANGMGGDPQPSSSSTPDEQVWPILIYRGGVAKKETVPLEEKAKDVNGSASHSTP